MKIYSELLSWNRLTVRTKRNGINRTLESCQMAQMWNTGTLNGSAGALQIPQNLKSVIPVWDFLVGGILKTNEQQNNHVANVTV